MSAKDYFKLGENLNVSSPAKSLDEIGREIESPEYISTYVEQKDRFMPHVDYATASNFARYGSAEQYYEDAITRVYRTYPYDGSLKEKIEWHNESSYIDEYIFENRYPRTTGHAILSADGWGTLVGPIVGGYGAPATADLEFIQLKGGPHPDIDAASIAKAFPGEQRGLGGVANFYHEPSRRTSNLELDSVGGFSVEFWLTKPSFVVGSTEKEVIFDLWNGEASSSAGYGRLTIELTGTAAGTPFLVTVQSGTDGYFQQSIGATPTTASLTNWNHYAFTFISSSNDVETKFYLNGNLNQTLNTGTSIGEITEPLIANIGALRTAPSGNLFDGTAVTEGHGKLSGSLDEFRYWTKKRTSKDIGKYWFTQIAGGTNTDVALTGTLSNKYNEENQVDLGFYYKFNEGITGNNSTDSSVLDYSGRISNGTWTGYTNNSRNIGSAIVSASAAKSEFKDPIIYPNHPDVDGLLTTMKYSGLSHDLQNNAGIYHTIPSWITEEDEDARTLKKLTQVLGSYFDTLHLQIENLPKIKNVDYIGDNFKPIPFTERLLDQSGFISPDIFTHATTLESFANRDEVREFDKKLCDLKNIIYKNIYNNLVYIYKSKGTEKSLRNLIRCFGVDDELIKINLYANNTTYELKNNYRSTAYRKKYITFNQTDRFDATIYQSASSDVNSTLSYISGSKTSDVSREVAIPITVEAEVIFPVKPELGTDGYFVTPFVSSSLFGIHEAVDDSSDFTWGPLDNLNFQVYSVRDEIESKNVKFVLTSSLSGIPTLETGFFDDVYENQKWNLAVRVYLDKTNNGGSVKGGKLLDLIPFSFDDVSGFIELYGVHSVLDQVVNEFHVSGAMTLIGVDTDPSTTTNKRIYLGAHRTNFTGSVLQRSDVKISSARYWKNYLSNDVIKAHARDASNFGTERPYENIGATKSSLSNMHVPAMETLALHWDFDTVTGSDASGDFTVQDYSSGSIAATSRYGWIGNIVKNQHVGRGEFFPVDSTDVVNNEFLFSAKQRLPENINSDNMVNILTEDDEIFTRESRPITHFFAIEKSMYQTISEEMINFFATIVDFNNLIGEPVNRYRQEYKEMGKVRQLFYERVQNVPSLEKFINFYKWIDSSISRMILQLVPASANVSDRLRNVVESHILERNKYWTKFPTLEFKQIDPEVGLRGFTELLYDWEHGHAPLSGIEEDNCLWWKERTEKINTTITSGDSIIDSQRETFNDVNKHRGDNAPNLSQTDGTSYAGSTYAIRRFSKLYKLNVDDSRQIHGGVNFHKNKKIEYVSIATEIFGDIEPLPLLGIAASVNYLFVDSVDVDDFVDCDDVIVPNQKRKYKYRVQNSRESGSAGGYEFGKGDLLLPFNIHSSSVTTGYTSEVVASSFGAAVGGMDFTNIHVDTYGGDNDVPMQGPFTEKFVGGRQHRHVAINRYDSSLSATNNLQDQSTRTEAWYIFMGALEPAMGIVGPTYTSTGIHDKDTPRATRMREEFAKRPVNIRNIQQTTNPGIGNYESNWNVVAAAGRTANNAYFKDNGGVSLPSRFDTELPTTTHVHTLAGVTTSVAGNVFGQTSSNRFDTGSNGTEFTLPRRDLTGSNSVMVSRFSAPGGPEISSKGFLDIMAEEYSVHNALPYRNLSVRSSGSGEVGTIRMSIEGSTTISSARDREGLRTRLTRHCGQLGFDSQWGDPVGSYHKVNRNPLKRFKEI